MDEQPEHDETPPATPAATPNETVAEAPDFGPGGYLPDRASKRARKIVLRAPMGLQWVIGALAVGVVVAVAGWFALRDTTPTAPYVQVPELAVGAGEGVELWRPDATGADAIIVRSSARTRVFAWPGEASPVFCPASGLLETADGRAWRLTGRGLGGTPSLAEHPLIIDDGVLYADPTTTIDPLTPDPEPAATACT